MILRRLGALWPTQLISYTCLANKNNDDMCIVLSKATNIQKQYKYSKINTADQSWSKISRGDQSIGFSRVIYLFGGRKVLDLTKLGQQQIQNNYKNSFKTKNKNSSPQKIAKTAKKVYYQQLSVDRSIVNKQQQQINRQIKNMTKQSQISQMLKIHSHKLNINHYISLLQKLIYIQKIASAQLPKQSDPIHSDTQNIQQKYEKVFYGLKRQLFKTAYAPEVYVRFLCAFSRIGNQSIFCKEFSSSFMRVLKQEIGIGVIAQNKQAKDAHKQKFNNQNNLNQINEPKNLQEQQNKDQLKQQEQQSPTMSQVLSIQTNIKLIQALLRIINHKVSQQLLSSNSQQCKKVLFTLLTQTMTYLHTPVTPDRIGNATFFQLIKQYNSLYSKIKLDKNIVKSLVREGLTRVKREDAIRRIKNQEKMQKQQRKKIRKERTLEVLKKQKQPIQQSNNKQQKMQKTMVSAQSNISGQPQPNNEFQQNWEHKNTYPRQLTIINSLKKLLILQQIYLQNTKTSSIYKQILATKQNNVQYHIFAMLHNKLNKNFIQLLGKCTFYKQETDGANACLYWQHLEFVPLLLKHFRGIINIPKQIIEKCKLTQLFQSKYEPLISYLYNFYNLTQLNSNRISLLLPTQKIMLQNLKHDCNSLVHLLLSESTRQHIASTIVQKFINKLLVNLLIKSFSDLATELKIIIVWYLLASRQGKHKVKELKGWMKDAEKNRVTRNSDKFIIELTKYFIIPQQSRNKRASSHATTWYINLLVGNPQYISLLQPSSPQPSNSQPKQPNQPAAVNKLGASIVQQEQYDFFQRCLKVTIEDVAAYVEMTEENIFGVGWNGDNQSHAQTLAKVYTILDNTIQKIHVHSQMYNKQGININKPMNSPGINSIKNSSILMQSLLQHYVKKSINNCIFSSQHIDIIKQNSQYFIGNKDSLSRGSQVLLKNSQIQQVSKIIKNKLDNAVFRVYLLVRLVKKLNDERLSNHQTIKAQLRIIKEAYQKQLQLLNYQPLISSNHRAIMKCVNQMFES